MFNAVGDGRSALYGRVPAHAEVGCRLVDAVADASDAAPVPKLEFGLLDGNQAGRYCGLPQIRER